MNKNFPSHSSRLSIPLRTLILKDHPGEPEKILALLKLGGHEVQHTLANTADTFQQVLFAGEFDLILADLHNANWTALDALDALGKMGRDIPLIVITASGSDEAGEEYFQHGAADFVQSDRAARLSTAVRRALEERRLREERKATDDALRDTEAGLREALGAAQMGVWEWTLATDIVTWDENLYWIAGRDPKLPAPRYQDLGQNFAPESWERLEAAVEKAVTTGASYELDLEVIRPDGARRWVVGRGEARRDANGEVHRLRGTVQDITERKRAEELLRESERRYRDFIALSQEGVWRVELDPPIPLNLPENEIVARILRDAWIAECNKTQARNMGFAGPEEVVGKRLIEVMPYVATDPERLESFRTAIREDFPSRTVEFRGHNANGQLRDLLRTEVPIIENNCLVRMWGMTRDLTEVKSKEEALRKAEEEYRSIFEQALEGIYRTSPEGKNLAANPSLARMLGYDSAEEVEAMITDSTHQVWKHPDERASFLKLLDEQEVVRGYECEYLRKDGSAIWVSLSSRRVRGPDGRTLYYEGFMEDITGRKQTELAIRASRERYEAFMANSSDGIWRIELEQPISTALPIEEQLAACLRYGYIAECNDASARMFGFDRAAEMIGLRLTRLAVHDARRIGNMIAFFRAGYRLVDAEGESTDRNGKTHQLLNSFFGVVENGCLLRAWGVQRDITRQKHAEEEISRLKHSIDVHYDGAYWTDSQNRFIYVNEAACKSLGYSRDELLHMNLLEVNIKATPERMKLVWERLRTHGFFSNESVHRRKDGSEYPVEIVTSYVQFRGAEYACGFARDISERRRTQEDLQRSLEQLRALAARLRSIREEERKSVAREIHDELGQSLTAIKIDLSALAGELPSGEKKYEARTSSILKLVEESIRSVRRISTELRPGILDDLGLVAAIEWAGEDFHRRTKTACCMDLPAEDIMVEPEQATAIFRIFQETLTNVARHAGASRVDVRLAREDGDLTLEVHDNGSGIAGEKLLSGSSLGILGMRERTSLLGGEFTISGSSDIGTTIRVRIPENPRLRSGPST